MRHAVLVSWLAMRTLPRRQVLVPFAARQVAGAVLAWLDHRRQRIDGAAIP